MLSQILFVVAFVGVLLFYLIKLKFYGGTQLDLSDILDETEEVHESLEKFAAKFEENAPKKKPAPKGVKIENEQKAENAGSKEIGDEQKHDSSNEGSFGTHGERGHEARHRSQRGRVLAHEDEPTNS